MGEGDSNFARNQRMTAAEMMARKTRLCQEIWQRQVTTQPSVHVLLCFAVMLCCHAFAVVLCSHHALLSCFACPSTDVHTSALSVLHVLHWLWLVGGLLGSPEAAMPLLWVQYSFFCFFVSLPVRPGRNHGFAWLTEQCSRMY